MGKTKWGDGIVEFIENNYKGIDNIELARLINEKFNFNINNRDVASFKVRYKIKTGKDLSSGINKGCFKSGRTPINKGQKDWYKNLPKESRDKMKKTQFKKGHISYNELPLGSEIIKGNDFIYIKIKSGKNKKNWKAKHHMIWEEHHGKIPKGYNVIFADGNRRNFDIDNLMLVTHAEELDLNMLHLRFNDKELTKTGLNIVKVHKKIVEKEKEK